MTSEALRRHAVEIVFAVIIAATYVQMLQISSGSYFFGDDWTLLRQAGSFRGMLEPYNDHLSVTILAVYRISLEVFGFTYWPLRAFGLLCLMAVPITYFATTRRSLTPPLAAVAALSLLGFAEMELNPAWFNHYLALVGGIVCAAALNRGRRADLVLAAALAFSLCAAGGGVAVAAACVVHNVCVRAHWRRWLAVLVPSALWGLWWVVAARGTQSEFRPARRPGASDTLSFARDVAWAPFDHLGLGVPVLAAALAVAFLGYGMWTLRRGFAAASSFLAWSIAVVVWAAGLGYSRSSQGIFGAPEGITFRYQLVALGFTLLAVVPRRPIRWPARFPLATSPQWQTAAAVAILVMSGAAASAMRDELERRAGVMESVTGRTKGHLVVLELGPGVVPDSEGLPGLLFLDMRAGEVRSVLDRYRRDPLAAGPAEADRVLVELEVVESEPVRGGPDRGCDRLSEPVVLPVDVQTIRLWASETAVEVHLRRFGTSWVLLDEVRAGEGVTVSLPRLRSDVPWQVQADGACSTSPQGT